MTPAELDAIFRAWRDEYFAANPEATEWRGTDYWFAHCLLKLEVEDYSEIFSLVDRHPGEMARFHARGIVVYRPGWKFAVADPPPLPASAPIPFPAGKALIPPPAPDVHAVYCPRCRHYFAVECSS